TRARENDGVDDTFRTFSKPRVDVAAQRHVFEIRAELPQERLTPERRAPDFGAGGKGAERACVSRDDDVARVFTLRDAADDEPARKLSRNVLHRVNREIRAAFEESILDLFHEEPF